MQFPFALPSSAVYNKVFHSTSRAEPIMSQLLILDWDPQHVRLLICSKQGGGLRMHSAQMASLEGDANATTIADALRPLVTKHVGGKSTVVALVGGRDVQCRLLRVPPAPDDELPDMVRLRASTEFPLADESAIIDFYPVPDRDAASSSKRAGDVQPKRVLAARLPEKTVKLARDVCSKLGLTLDHLTMRGCGLATLAVKHASRTPSGVQLVAAQRPGEIDLVALEGDAAAVVRSVTLPRADEFETNAKHVSRELRRTLPALASELETDGVDSIVWISGYETGEALASELQASLGVQVTPLNLRDTATLAGGDWPQDCAMFAGAAGIGDELLSGKLSIDFLAPRKRVEKETPKRTLALAGALAAIVFLGGGWLFYDSVARVERAAQIDMDERQGIEAEIEELATEKSHSEQVAAWLATDVNWLDEIDHLATTLRPKRLDDKEFAADDDVRLDSLVATKAAGNRGTGGTIALSGGVRDDDVLPKLEQALRDSARQVNSKNVLSDPDNAPYVWTFQSDLIVTSDAATAKREDRQ